MNRALIIFNLLLVSFNQTSCSDVKNMFHEMFSKCEKWNEIVICLKVQALKAAQRALQMKTLKIANGVSIVKNDNEYSNVYSRLLRRDQIEKLNSTQVDELLYDTAVSFLKTHTIQFSPPKLLEVGRKKKDKKGNMGLLVTVMAFKGFLATAAVKGVAMVASAALIIGKMALIFASLLGLKSLFADGYEKTIFEIVKHPVHSQSKTYFGGHGDATDHFYRNIRSDEEINTIEDKMSNNSRFNKVYRGHVGIL